MSRRSAARSQPSALRQEIEALHDAEGLVLRGRGRLREGHAPLLVHGDQVGEGAADVDPDPVHVSAPSGLAARGVRTAPRVPAIPAAPDGRGPARDEAVLAIVGAGLGRALARVAVAAPAARLDQEDVPGRTTTPTSFVRSTRSRRPRERRR